MYKCKPERNPKQVALLMIASVLLTIGAFALGILWKEYQGAINLAAMFIAAIALYIIIRFTMTEMEYTLDNGTFIITKIVGSKRTDQGALDLAETIDLVTKEEYRSKGYNKNYNNFFNYSQNLGGKHWFFVVGFAGKRAVIEFEPNDAFVAIMKDEIEKAKKEPKSQPPYEGPGGGLLV
ncbi:MAG: hypothetical protein E7651_07190 [Ruminococcaceae bacterium]|nr:hypothetical protein [Oscillospiraceae bacterium]